MNNTNKHKYSTIALVFILVTIGIGYVFALTSDDMDELCAINNMSLIRWNGNWQCMNLNGITINNSYNNITNVISNYSLYANNSNYLQDYTWANAPYPAELAKYSFGFNNFIGNGSFLTSGNVSIGTNNTISKLNVVGITSYSGEYLAIPTINVLSSNTAAIGYGASISLGGESGEPSTPYSFARILGAKESAPSSGSYAGYVSFWTTAGTGTADVNSANYERVRISSIGNLGIGSKSTPHLLTINTSTYDKTEIGMYNSFNQASNRNWALATNRANYGDFHIMQSNYLFGNPTSNGTSRLVIGNTGNVGIGTTTPSQTLDVRGDGNFSGTVYINNNTNLATLVNSSFNQTLINSLYVPYTGASGNVNLGNYNLTTNGLNVSKYISGTGNITAVDGSFAFGKITQSAGNKVEIKADAAGQFVFGNIIQSDINSTSKIYASSNPSMVFGSISNTGPNNTAQIYSTGFSSIAGGRIQIGSFGRANSNFNLGATGNGCFVWGLMGANNEGRNGTLTCAGAGSFALGNTFDGTINSAGDGSFALGYNRGVNSIIQSSKGAFVHGYIPSNNYNLASVLASGDGSFVHGYITGLNNFILASGENTVIIGSSNMTVSGTSSIAFGKNLNITGTNTFGYGTNNTMSVITGNNLFALASANLVISDTNFTAPYPLTVNKGIANISAWFQNQISATGYLTRTDVYEKSTGLAVDKIKDASYYKKADGTINHTAFGYSAVKYTVKEQVGVENKNETYESCTTDKGKEPLGLDEEKVTCKNETRIVLVPKYADKTYEAVDLVKEVSLLKQALYEVNEKNKNLEIRISNIESTLK